MEKRFERLKVRQLIEEANSLLIQQAVQAQREQLWSGRNRFGSRILPTYADSTIRKKKRKGLPWDRVTGYHSGSMYNMIYARKVGNGIEIYSYSGTASLFTKKYGGSVWGLNEDSRKKLAAQRALITVLKSRL